MAAHGATFSIKFGLFEGRGKGIGTFRWQAHPIVPPPLIGSLKYGECALRSMALLHAVWLWVRRRVGLWRAAGDLFKRPSRCPCEIQIQIGKLPSHARTTGADDSRRDAKVVDLKRMVSVPETAPGQE